MAELKSLNKKQLQDNLKIIEQEEKIQKIERQLLQLKEQNKKFAITIIENSENEEKSLQLVRCLKEDRISLLNIIENMKVSQKNDSTRSQSTINEKKDEDFERILKNLKAIYEDKLSRMEQIVWNKDLQIEHLKMGNR